MDDYHNPVYLTCFAQQNCFDVMTLWANTRYTVIIPHVIYVHMDNGNHNVNKDNRRMGKSLYKIWPKKIKNQSGTLLKGCTSLGLDGG